MRAQRAEISPVENRRKIRKTPQKEQFWGSKANTWLGNLSGVISSWWGVGGTSSGCCSLLGLGADQARAILAPVTQFCSDLLLTKPFLPAWARGAVNPLLLGSGDIARWVVPAQGCPKLLHVVWDHWENKYPLDQVVFLGSIAGLGSRGNRNQPNPRVIHPHYKLNSTPGM